MEIVAIFLSLGLLMFFAYRGFSVILFAPVFALLAGFLSGLPLLPTYTEVFMPKTVGFVKNFFPLFMLGAVLGKVMEDSGSARKIALLIVKTLGKERAVMAIITSGIVLCYGGVSTHVISFALYPLAAALFREANYPKRLIPACIAFGAFGLAMDALPGTPQIQNLIPTMYFGTTAYAAPVTGTIAAILLYLGGVTYMEWRRKKLVAAGEGYGEGHINEPSSQAIDDTSLPNGFIAILPLLIVLIGNFLFTKWIATWDPSILQGVTTGVSLKSVTGIWALIIALTIAITTCVLINYARFQKVGGFGKTSQVAILGSLLAVMNTASEVGYGNVIATLSGFKSISSFLMTIHIGNSPLLSEGIMVNVIAGITGSASGGLGIAMELMGKTYLDWGLKAGVNPEVLHRIASLAAGGMDTLPHNGAVITVLAICGLTHKQSYADIFVLTLLKTGVAFLMIILVTIFPFLV
jgi:H+/gluconate symporter-like permease